MIYRDDLGKLFDQFFNGSSRPYYYTQTYKLVPNDDEGEKDYEVNITKDGAYLHFEVPGFNKSNLEVNLITQLYLQNVLILINDAVPGVPAKIDPSLTPIYSYYTIDPDNKLVGDTPCGIQKYINYMIIDTNSIIEGGCPDDVVVVNCFCQP